MKAFAPYLTELRHLLSKRREDPLFFQLAEQAVNGQASSRLVSLVSTYGLKRTGAFFSSSLLSDNAASGLLGNQSHTPILVTDPACGAGNLLIAAAHRLPIRRNLTSTLEFWGQHLAGFDLHAEFVKATHLRLAILAISRGSSFDLEPSYRLERFFPNIRQGDGLRELSSLKSVSHLLINPPFGPITAPKDCSWAQGKVTKAAVFFDRCLNLMLPNSHLSGILPDVLRSGSRYQRWRQSIENRAEILKITPAGNFETADVDVFHLDLKVRMKSAMPVLHGNWWTTPEVNDTVGGRFDTHVGAVVPHRLKKGEGPIYPFCHAKQLPFWGEFSPKEESVSFAGTVVRPPFVAIRRTSSPSDKFRALGTIILGDKPIAVENHLIVCRPKSGGLKACKQLLSRLRLPATNSFLNQRIRCRHLTVGVVKEIPWTKRQP